MLFVGRHFRVQLVRGVLAATAAPEENGRTENGKPAWCLLGAKVVVGWRRPEVEEGLVSLAAAEAVGGQGGPPSDPTT